MIIYERIDQLRKKKGVKWGYLNEQISGYRGKLTEVKNGKTTLTDIEINKLAKALGTTPDYLLGATDDPTPAGGQKEKPASNEGSELSPAEKSLIQLFRLVPPESQEMVTQMIQAALKSQGLLP